MSASLRIAQGTLYAACLAGGVGLWLWAPWKGLISDGSARAGSGAGDEAPAKEHRRPSRELSGVVRDAQGAPVAGVRVEFRAPFDPEFAFANPAAWTDTGGESGGGVTADAKSPGSVEDAALPFNESQMATEQALAGRFASAVTNDAGEFKLQGVADVASGELHYGLDLFEGDPLRSPVHSGAGSQVLVLPARPAGTPLVKVRVVDGRNGQPLEVEHLLTRLLRLPTVPVLDPSGSGRPLPRRALRQPSADQVRRGPGWVELELWPGTWWLELASARSRATVLEFQVPRDGKPVELEVELDVFAAADGWELLAPVVDGELALEPESSNGFSEYTLDVQPNRPLGEIRRNLTFRHTLRFEPGEFTEAYLELELEAGSSMAYNDSLGLEFGLPPKFGFHQYLSTIHGDWRVPMHERVFVDLSSAIGFHGEVDVRPMLTDGQLDIYVQDDTGVHDLRLYLRRK